MSLSTSTSAPLARPVLSVEHHLRGVDNYDEWHFELMQIILPSEGLTEFATKCAGTESVWSVTGLRRALRVFNSDVKILREYFDAVTSLADGETAPAHPPLKDPSPPLSEAVAKYLEEHRSWTFTVARSEQAALERLLPIEMGNVERSCALVYASLSDSVRRDAAAANLYKCAHCILKWLSGKFCSAEQRHASAVTVYTRFHNFKFDGLSSLEVNLGSFDKLRYAVEKLEGGRTLSESHLASALLSALPACITTDLHVWRGARPSIPYAELRDLLAQHWHELQQRYPASLGAVQTTPTFVPAAAPAMDPATALHLGATSPADLMHPFRRGQRDAERYARGSCDYCGISGHTTYVCTKLSRAFHQNAVRRDFQFPPGWVAIPPAELPQHGGGGGGRRQHGGPQGGNHDRHFDGPRGHGAHGSGQPSAPPMDIPSLFRALQEYGGHAAGYASSGSSHGHRDNHDHRDGSRSPPRQSEPRHRSRTPARQSESRHRSRTPARHSEPRHRSRSPDRGYGEYRDDSRHDDRDNRGRSRDPRQDDRHKS